MWRCALCKLKVCNYHSHLRGDKWTMADMKSVSHLVKAGIAAALPTKATSTKKALFDEHGAINRIPLLADGAVFPVEDVSFLVPFMHCIMHMGQLFFVLFSCQRLWDSQSLPPRHNWLVMFYR